jgi:hypothetical protein
MNIVQESTSRHPLQQNPLERDDMKQYIKHSMSFVFYVSPENDREVPYSITFTSIWSRICRRFSGPLTVRYSGCQLYGSMVILASTMRFLACWHACRPRHSACADPGTPDTMLNSSSYLQTPKQHLQLTRLAICPGNVRGRFHVSSH